MVLKWRTAPALPRQVVGRRGMFGGRTTPANPGRRGSRDSAQTANMVLLVTQIETRPGWADRPARASGRLGVSGTLRRCEMQQRLAADLRIIRDQHIKVVDQTSLEALVSDHTLQAVGG